MPESPSSILDAHVHLWDTSRFELPWLANVPELSDTYGAGDLSAAVGNLPVQGAVAVQAGESSAEAAWLLGDDTGAAGAGALPTRVVLQYAPAADGWLGAVHRVAAEHLSSVAGVRIPLHRRSPDWTDLEGLEALVSGLEERGLILELLLRPDQTPVVHDLAREHPGLDIVLCHLGVAAAPPTPEWRAAMANLATIDNVSAKISGLFSPLGTMGEGDARARDAVAEAVDTLGPDRLMFGSDWPMSTRVGAYAEVVERTARLLPELTLEESAAIWRRTTERLYTTVRGTESWTTGRSDPW
jgi:L-fucono-1,5-lactonase